tara:strand:- start:112 stop:327 length:216 start_codon:yes stop_codon:yes gene_type:complete
MLLDWEQELELDLPELEAALKVVQTAWDSSEETFVEANVPEQLQHLTRHQWEVVCQLLSWIWVQQAESQIH